ncbi:UDP-N-acetyl-D-mannosaminuronic acid dehydrogenase [Dehalogenimonas formicexedens]|uniref:UDP-N-acetyl-D-mannosaminuronic acid dehydrogenase n=1 Tax=Dehalogenimonas formicexedens TaxID=1839801 RepID=A0A1P8F9J4_9CHLR|nr:nucleotide sugar dehydrogenase [Dehalogenimonas formicexedens]APV45139.1 UDP-N-acetyl-D-mannosaminuronic acid dehydrogenase [Dehalogenimonas formicexedens]
MIYNLSETEIRSRIANRDVSIGFIGLGRVGLPLAATLANEGFPVLGMDINKNTVATINAGRTPISDENGLGDLISNVVGKGKLTATTAIEDTAECDVYIISVPTLIKDQDPDIDAVVTVSHRLAKILKPGKLVVLQSTVPPGTTQNTLAAIIQRESDLIPGLDFGLAYSPERTQAPQVLRDLKSYAKIVGGLDSKSALILGGLYGAFAPSIITMSSIIAAELDKVVENTYRDVNIAFANELAQICNVYGVNVDELIHTANSQPYCHILKPGLVGGHCIPMDPYYIISDLIHRGYFPRLIKTARDLNESVFKNIADMLDRDTHRVAVLGLSFKKDVKSFETSHSLKLIKLLESEGKDVVVHDPFISDETFPFKATANIDTACQNADAIIVSTEHSIYEALDLAHLRSCMNGRLIIDVRGILSPTKVAQYGFEYRGLGR